MLFEIEVYEGKYKVVVDDKYRIVAYRHGEFWQDLTGDNLVYNLAYELAEAKKKIDELEEYKFMHEGLKD